jgi:hypothetical protein
VLGERLAGLSRHGDRTSQGDSPTAVEIGFRGPGGKIVAERYVQNSCVEKEVETAFEKERRQDNKPVLFPIRLDDAVMQTDQAWAADIRRTRHIGDFTRWKEHDAYQQAFQRLLRDLAAPAGADR